MQSQHRSNLRGIFDIALYAVIFLFFFQLVTDLVEATYSFGLMMTGVPVQVSSILLLFSPLLLLAFPRKASSSFAAIAAGLGLLCRIASVLLGTGGRLIASGLGAGLLLLFIPMTVALCGQKKEDGAGWRLAAGIALAALLSMLLRALFSGNDISGYGMFHGLSLLLAIPAFILLPGWARRMAAPAAAGVAPQSGSAWRSAGLCLGLSSAWVLLYFAFANPGVMARWSSGSYGWITGLAAGSLAVFLALWTWLPGMRRTLSPRLVFAWNLVFAALLGFAVWSFQVPFPADSASFPLAEPAVGPLAGIALALAILLHPVIYADLALFLEALIKSSPSIRRLSGGFSLFALFLLVMVFAQVFTTVYDYIPVAGPALRDRFWLVFLVVGIVLCLCSLLLRKEDAAPVQEAQTRVGSLVGIAGLGLAAAAVLAVALTSTHPAPAADKTSLRILTYNIQQGYSQSGEKDFTSQLKLIRQADADIIGLEETDTARIAGGNSDVVRFMADQLNMYSYYGPTTVTGTFGVALLSRYPIHDAQVFFMYSKGEQTAAILAQIDVGGKTFNMLVTHLGNGGPLVQQQQLLQRLAGKENVIAVGDFNFRPYEEQFHLTTGVLEDAWTAAGAAQQHVLPPGQDINDRIDYVYLTPGTQVSSAEYYGKGPSDHPAMLAEIKW
jgi:endonuclease/exonuclease/phosphatase family metal-dependent hydrolase